jgi:cytoskeletal protein CcmA (bactofilin family)
MGNWRRRSTDGVDGSDIVSLIGEGTVFTGDLVLKGGARIDGKVVGRLTAHALLIVGPSGEIDAQELHATHVTVCGSVRGKLVVTERLEIQEGGRVSGQVVMEKKGLIISPGGTFEGAVEYAREGESENQASSAFAVEATVGSVLSSS